MNTAEFLTISSAVVPDRDAVVSGDRRVTYAEMALRVNRLANALRNHPQYRDQVTLSFVRSIGIGSALHDIGKVAGADHHRGNSPVFQAHCVVHTARSTGASIRNGGDHEVAAFGQRIHNLLGGRPGVDEIVHR